MAYKDEDFSPQKTALKYGLLAFVGIMLLTFVLGTFFTVDAGTQVIMLTWGKASPQSIGPGLHFKWPIAQHVVIMDTRTQKYAADSSAASSDLQDVHAQITTNYHISADNVVDVYQRLGLGFSDSVIQPAEQEVVKAVTAKFTAEELVTKRPQVAELVEQELRDKLAPRGIIVESTSITDFDFSDSFNKAIEEKVTAVQQKLKAQNDLERIRVEAEQAVATAEGAKAAAIAKAEGEAEAARIINDQLKNAPQYVSYLIATRWDGKLPMYTGGPIPLLNLPSQN